MLESTLRGHSGCVNRLAWNDAGTLLASGSDDRRVSLHLLKLEALSRSLNDDTVEAKASQLLEPL